MLYGVAVWCDYRIWCVQKRKRPAAASQGLGLNSQGVTTYTIEDSPCTPELDGVQVRGMTGMVWMSHVMYVVAGPADLRRVANGDAPPPGGGAAGQGGRGEPRHDRREEQQGVRRTV